MKSHKAAVRYSKAWFDLAIERGDIESCYNDVNLVLSVLAENKELKVMLKSPVIKQDTKAKFLSKIFGSKINKRRQFGHVSHDKIGLYSGRWKVPERPPDFSQRASSPITMDLSALLHMS